MKKFVVLFTWLSISLYGFSQSYDMEAGIRSGLSSGVSLRVLTGSDDWV